MTQEKIADRIRKLLELSHSDNEHEAATAAARAAQLMSDHSITEAMIEVVAADETAPHVPERIIESGLDEKSKERIAWRDRIVSALATSLDCERFYTKGNLIAFGRESNVQTWKYTATYLIAEVDRLANEAWLREGADLVAVGASPRNWKAAFRLGVADTIHDRIYTEHYARKAKEKAAMGEKAKELAASHGETVNEPLALVRVNSALEIIAKDRSEVAEKYKKRTKGFRATSSIGNTVRGRSGYGDGREAGKTVALKGGGKQLARGDK